ncbi:fibronectin type III domain-containing protein [Nocardioides rubriscoriae]|uniref:fibronectin type III domain-containing protein n=1 Tax=Nocardioides rubriscoriae TaxID=642762 RepID=UPI001478DE4C|nr:fibronectin type III domain-containing protein [Nocardioides rubriscoriae]
MGVPQPASADPLGITLVHLRSSTVELSVVCPTDPPTNVLVYAGASQPRSVGVLPIDCVGGGVPQTVVVPLTETFAVGSTVDLSATVSGDSGEINAWFPGTVVEADTSVLHAPGRPSHVHVHARVRRVAVTWRNPVADPSAPVEGFRVWMCGHRVEVSAHTHRVVIRGLLPSRRYTVHVAAHNDAGRSPVASTIFRTHRA